MDWRIDLAQGADVSSMIPGSHSVSRLLIKNVESQAQLGQYAAVAEQAARAGGRVLVDMLGRAQIYEKGPKDLVTEADKLSQHVIESILLNAFPHHKFIGEESFAPSWEDVPASGGELPVWRWVVDPLDGTANYVHNLPGFAVSIGLEQGGKVLAGAVFDPILNECYVAASGQGAFLNGRRLRVSDCRQMRDAMVAASFPANVERSDPEIVTFGEILVASQSLRRLGSAALNLSYLAAGRIDAYWATRVKPWDVAAGALLVHEAGGVITAVDGSPFQLSHPKFAAAATPELHAQLVSLLGSNNLRQ